MLRQAHPQPVVDTTTYFLSTLKFLDTLNNLFRNVLGSSGLVLTSSSLPLLKGVNSRVTSCVQLSQLK